MKKIIGVVSGGYTSERGISQKSGRVVFEALLNTPFECYHIDIAQEAWTVRDANGTQHEINKSDFSILVNGENKSFDCVVNMIHGAPGENGQLAGYFELLNLPHTSCSSAMAALTYDKRNCLAVTDSFGIPSAKRIIFNEGDSVELDEIINTVGLPCFVKANRAGSSFGVYKVSEKTELNSALEGALKEDNELLIEAALEGREITVGVLERKGKIEVLPITEIISENDFFDYEAKYEGKSQEITPAKLPLEWEKAAKKMAEKIYKTMGLRGITRTEFIFVDGVPHLLEINTIPGMTLQSIIPQQAEAAGISMENLLTDLIETSISKKT
ncbi:MAG: D-alanine--D-alanine ligase [Flavobacteriaceae bacterium]